jgi:hypothetical protein
MAVASAKFEAGSVYFPEDAPWLANLEAELFAFPGSGHDDQCDSISPPLSNERIQDLATYIKAFAPKRDSGIGAKSAICDSPRCLGRRGVFAGATRPKSSG